MPKRREVDTVGTIVMKQESAGEAIRRVRFPVGKGGTKVTTKKENLNEVCTEKASAKYQRTEVQPSEISVSISHVLNHWFFSNKDAQNSNPAPGLYSES